MMLLNPEYLLFMIIVLLFSLLIIKKENDLNTIFDKEILEKLTFNSGGFTKRGRNFMLFIALSLIVIALSRPVIQKGEVQIKGKKIDMLIALDISKSMKAADIYPNRLEFAKKKIYDFIDSFEEANIGVIAFSSDGFLVSPMTQDGATLKYLIKNLSLESLSTTGTDLLIPIKKGKTFLKDSKQKIVIIFTDGGDNDSFEEELKAAKEADEHIYIYATATTGGAPILENKIAIKDKEGNIVISRLNQKIKTLAIESGGAYIVGGLKDNSIDLLVKDIKNKFKMQDTSSKTVKEYKELFYYPLALATIFLLLAFSSFPRRVNSTVFVLLFLILTTKNLHSGILDFQTIDRANQAYQDKNYKEAVTAYEEVVKSKKTPQSLYDLANALYKNGQYKKALSTYQKVETKEKNLQYKKLFNMGNTLVNLKRYKEALETFQKAKKIKTEPDLQHNITVTKKLLEKKRKEQEKKKDKKKGKGKDKKEEKNKDKKKKKKEEKNKEKKKSQDKDKDKQDTKESGKKEDPSTKQEHPQKAKQEPISEKEMKKWQEQLEKMKPKTMPMKFQDQPIKRSINEKPW